MRGQYFFHKWSDAGNQENMTLFAKHKSRTGILYLQYYLFTRSKWSQAVWSMLRSHELIQRQWYGVSKETVASKHNLSANGFLLDLWKPRRKNLSASREKSSGIVQNKTKRVTKDSSDLSFLFCFYPDPLVSWEHSCRNQRGGQFAISFWWTIKKAHQFSIPNSNASTVNKSVW